MLTRRLPLTALPLLAALLLALPAHAQQLGDPSFEALAGKDAPRSAAPGGWYIPAGPPYADGISVRGDKAAARTGAAGLSLSASVWGRLAAARQTVDLPAGVYEFTVWGKGDGLLVLTAGNLRRKGDLGKEWAQYSLTFSVAQAGPVDLTLLATHNASVDDAALSPASPERLAAWQKQETARAEYGFVPDYLSAQAPQPGAPVAPAGAFQPGPVSFHDKVVYCDEKYDAAWSFHPETLSAYLGTAGFQRLDAEAFGAWMKKATAGGAYGTVCVMTMGICPGSVWDDQVDKSPIKQYLEAGGRVVWVGDVPFEYMQDATHPQVFSKGALTTLLGIRGDWSVGCWGNQGDSRLTALGKTWGLSDPGAAVIAAYPEDITAALSGFHSDYAGSDLAPYYLKTFNPLYPWSGFIFCHRANDFNNADAQQSVYRVALYAGTPVTAPAPVAGVAASGAAQESLKVTLDPPRDRRYFYRGETIPVKIEATPNTPAREVAGGAVLVMLGYQDADGGGEFGVANAQLTGPGHSAQVSWSTADWACRDYNLAVWSPISPVPARPVILWQTKITICPRPEDPTFFFGVSGATAHNPYRQEMVIKDLAAHGMQNGCGTTDTPPGIFDLGMKYGVRFGMRAHGQSAGLTDAEREEAQIRGPNGEKIPGAWEGGRPILGLLSPRVRALVSADMAKQVAVLAAWPSSWPRCQTNDDFSMYYGWDYSDLARRDFKDKTGLDAPVPPELAKLGAHFRDPGNIAHAPGIIPDNDPWLQWNIFTTQDIGGGYNKALTDACAAAVPGMKVGPVPGSMMFPFWETGQYPPHDFGPGGFNLLYYYTYLNYWQPTVGNLYWNEIGRIGNRDLELWTEPDCLTQPSPTYFTNTFYCQVAGGAQGLNYYSYGEAGPLAWKTLGEIGNTIVKPYYPFLGKLRPARTSVGLLLPYTCYCYDWLYAIRAVYPFANLLGAHVDIQPTCEEEVLSGDASRYKVLVLWRVQYLRQSVVTALEDYIAKGGVVICDATTAVPIKGAIKTSVDLAMGDGKSNPDPNDPRFGGPGILDYLHPDRVALVRQAVAPYASPWTDCADPTLVGVRHEYHGVTYLWLVNIESEEEYEYVRPRLGAGAAPKDPAKASAEAAAYLADRAIGKRFQPQVTIPAGNWAAYDVLQGKRITLSKAGERMSFSADMPRLGGELVALYPEPIARVSVQIAPQILRGQSLPLTVRILDPDGKAIAGTQPLAVRIITPAGDWPEITGAHATDDGTWTAPVNPAGNDAPGQWRVVVRELSSGLRGEATVTVK